MSVKPTIFRCLFIVTGILFFAGTAAAQLAPEVGYVFPAGGKAGTSVEVKLGGYDWTPDMQFFVHDPRVKLDILGPPGELLIPPPPYWFGARSKLGAVPIAREVPARFVIPANMPPGVVRWQAANANGATAAGIFIVGAGAEIVEDEKRKGPTLISALPVTVSGRLIKNEEIDQYRFTARSAGPVTCMLAARRLGANFHGVLEVHEADGRLVERIVDTEGLDPALTFVARANAEYVVRVRDIDHAGDRSYVYRLTVASGPRVLAALPAGGRRGETRPVEFVGIGVATGAAKVESVIRSVAFPADPALASFPYKLETPWGAAAPFTLFASDVPETVVAESPGVKPVSLQVPGAVTSIFSHPNAENSYSLTGKKGDRFAIAVEARVLGSPLDVSLAVRGPDGKELVRNDDLPETTDAGLDFVLPANGTYTLVVSDVSGAGSSRAAVYRLVVRRPVDDFYLTAAAQRQSVLIGKNSVMTVKANRVGNFAGPIRLAVSGLPQGLRVPPNLAIPADKAELAITIEAPPDAPASAALVTVSGMAEIGGKTVTRLARANAGGNLAPRHPEENEVTMLAIATTLKPRCKGEPVDRDTGRKAARGATFPAEINIERLEGFQGEIVLKMASRQSYQIQGITGGDVVVPPGVPRPIYPCFMPEWLETSRTSRMGIIAEAKVADPRGTIRHSVVAMGGFITMTMEGALLKISHEAREQTVHPGQPFEVRIRIARSPQLADPVRLELRIPQELQAALTAAPVLVPPNQHEADFLVNSVNHPSLLGEQTLTIRATTLDRVKLPVVSETAVQILFKGPAGALPKK